MIYVFDNFENLIDIVRREDLIKCQLVQSINSFTELTIEAPVDFIEDFKDGTYIGVIDNNDNMRLFTYDLTVEETLVIKGIERGYSDLNTAKPIKDKRPKKVSGSAVMNIILEGTGYELGHCDVDNLASASFYYLSPLECIKKVISTWICEIQFRYTFQNNKILGRYVDVYKKQGQKTGLQFIHGDNVLRIKQEITRSNIVTALIGRGKGEEKTDANGEATGGYGRRIEFTDIVWSKTNGKPINKPAGQNYIELEMPKHASISNFIDGNLSHRWGIYVNEDIEDPEVLLDLTYKQLIAHSKPEYTYSVDIVDLNIDIHLGDSVAVIYDDIDLAVECRVTKLKSDLLNTALSSVELGEYYDYRSERQKANSSALTMMNQKFEELHTEQTDAFTELVKQKMEKHRREFDEQIRLQTLEYRLQHEANERLIREKALESERKFNETLAPLRAEARQSQEQFNQRITQTTQQLAQMEQRANNNIANAISRFDTANRALDNKLNTAISNFNNEKTLLNSDLTNLRANLDAQMRNLSNNSQTMRDDINSAKQKLAEADSKYVKTAAYETNLDEIAHEIQEVANENNQTSSKVAEFKQNVDSKFDKIGNLTELPNGTLVSHLNQTKATANEILTTLTSGVSGANIPTKINKFIENKTSEGIVRTLSNSVGGRNYIRDYSMKSLVNKFMKLGNDSEWRFEAVEDNTAKSGYYIKATCIRAGSGSNGFHYPLFDLRGSQYQGKKMTWGIDIKTSHPIDFFSSGFEAGGTRGCQANSEWQRLTHTFNVNFVKYWSFVLYSSQIRSGDIVYIRDTQLEDGMIATTARVAEDDFKSELAEYKQTASIQSAKLSDVTSKLNETSTRVSSVEQTANSIATELSTFKRSVDNAGYATSTSMTNTINNTAASLRQELSRVSQSIDNKGFITTTAATNLVNSRADEFTRELTSVKKSIPQDFSGNLLIDSGRHWRTDSYHCLTYQLAEQLQEGQTYTFTLQWWIEPREHKGKYLPMLYYNSDILALTGGLDKDKPYFQWNSQAGAWTVTFTVPLKNTMSSAHLAKFNSSDKYIKVYRYGSPQGLSHNDNQTRVFTAANFATLVKGPVPLSKWQKSWAELDSNLITLNTFKQNAEGTLSRFEQVNSEQTRKISQIESGLNGINLSVQTVTNNLNNLQNQTVKHSEVNVTADGVTIGSKQILNGQSLTSMLTVNPNNIKAITDKMIITNQSSNLLSGNCEHVLCTKRDNVSDRIIAGPLKNGDKFLLKFKGFKQSKQRLNILFYIRYNDNTNWWIPIRIDDKPVIRVDQSGNSHYDFELEFTMAGLDNNKVVVDYRVGYQIDAHSDFGYLHVEHAELYQKLDANLFVDGSITAKQIETGAITSSKISAGAIDATKIATNAIESRHLRVNQALIDSLTADQMLVKKLISQDAFINKLSTIQFDFTKATGEYIGSSEGGMKWLLNENLLTMDGDAMIQLNSEDATICRRKKGFPTQFLRMTTGKSDNTRNARDIAITVIGSNRDMENEFMGNGNTFAGIRIWNDSLSKDVEIISDLTKIVSPDKHGNLKGWLFASRDTRDRNETQLIAPKNRFAYSAVEAKDFRIITPNGGYVGLTHFFRELLKAVKVTYPYFNP